jgi:hypothetical protein
MTAGAMFMSATDNIDWMQAQDQPRRSYLVRKSVRQDHKMIEGDTNIIVIRIRDWKKWIFAERSVSFPYGFQDSDEYAAARLAANERYGRRLFGGVR